MSFLDGFSPVVAYCNRDDKCIDIFFRVCVFVAIIVGTVLCFMIPEILECNYKLIIKDVISGTQKAYNFTIEWGNNRLMRNQVII